MQPFTSVAEKIPAEMWMEVFKHVPKSSDLRSVSVASRRFHALTTRAIHRDLVWDHEKYAEHNLRVWKDNPGMEACVRSLDIGIGGTPSNNSPEENAAFLNNDVVPVVLAHHTPPNRQAMLERERLAKRVRLYNVAQLQHVLWARVQTFTNISSLKLHNMTIRSGHFHLIHSLKQLRSLRLAVCTIEDYAADGFDNRTLPITELSMLAIRRGYRPVAHRNIVDITQLLPQGPGAPIQLNPAPPVPNPFAQALSLAIAANLRTLTIDFSANVFSNVFDAPAAQALGWIVPATLEHLYVLRKHTISAPEPTWPRSDEGGFADTSVYGFCSLASSLKTISTPVFAPSQQTTMAPEALPPGLKSFAGPFDSARFVATHRDVKALGLLKCRADAPQIVEALTVIACERPRLEMLLLEVKTWDAEMMVAISQHFKQLRRLKLVYGNGGPNETFLVNLGPTCLSKFSQLHTLEVYKLPPKGKFEPEHPAHLFDPTYASLEEEMRELLLPWSQSCPKLRKVQLVSGYIMTRQFEGGLWTTEKISRLGRIEYLDY